MIGPPISPWIRVRPYSLLMAHRLIVTYRDSIAVYFIITHCLILAIATWFSQ